MKRPRAASDYQTKPKANHLLSSALIGFKELKTTSLRLYSLYTLGLYLSTKLILFYQTEGADGDRPRTVGDVSQSDHAGN